MIRTDGSIIALIRQHTQTEKEAWRFIGKVGEILCAKNGIHHIGSPLRRPIQHRSHFTRELRVIEGDWITQINHHIGFGIHGGCRVGGGVPNQLMHFIPHARIEGSNRPRH